MKKAISVIFAMSVMLTCMAQEHLLFKGIPITGSMKEFCAKLTAKGFTNVGSDKNASFFIGDFTGRNSTVCVGATQDGNNVYGVLVLFDTSEDWNMLVKTYDHYKELYTRKYGKTTFCKEYNPSIVESNTSLMYELNQGTVVWGSSWSVAGGEIDLSIEKGQEYNSGIVMFRYRDTLNIEDKIQQELGDI